MASPGSINRTLLQSFFQNAGDIYDDTKTEGAINVLADQSDANWQYMQSLVPSGALTPAPPSNLNLQSIINANLAVVNEGTTFTIATGTSRYVVEMFKCANNGSGVNATGSQVALTDLPGSSFGQQIVHAGAPVTQGQLMQFHTLEATITADMAGQQRTLSVKIKGVVGMDRATLKVRYRTTNSAITDADTLVQAGTATAIVAGGYTKLTLTYTVPTQATLTGTGVIGFQVVGSKTTAEANGDGFITAQWQDNAGNTAMPFQGKSLPDEEKACRRYYQEYGTNGSRERGFAAGVCFSTSQMYAAFLFEKMRVTPTATVTNPTGFSALIPGSNIVASGIVISVSPGVTDSLVIIFTAPGTPFTAGQAALVRILSPNVAKIALDARL